MIYHLSLELMLTVVGWLLITAHVFMLIRGDAAQKWLRSFPRSRPIGFVLLAVATIWAWLLVANIDLGEFSNWRTRILIVIPCAAVLTWLYVDEFLAARALGMVALLAAEPLLDSAWLRPELSRLALVTLAYAWIVFALFWIGMPYTLREQIAWLTGEEKRWKVGAVAGIAYGLLLVILPLTLHRSA